MRMKHVLASHINCTLIANEYDALQAIYNSSNGKHWVYKNASQRWEFPSPMSAPCSVPWQGITCGGKQHCYVRDLELVSMNLMGTIPQNISNLPALSKLDLSSNYLYGTIDGKIFTTLERLQFINLQTNSVTGTLPGIMSTMKYLEVLNFGSNMLTGTLPNEWSTLSAMRALYMTHNNLFGTLPSSWQTMRRISAIGLGYSNFTGTLPSEWSTFVNISMIFLTDSQISGTLPSEWRFKYISQLSLGSNRINGTLPASWSEMKNLNLLSLASNCITGTIPPQWSSLSRLQTLYLGSNSLVGILPSSWSAMAQLHTFIGYCNHLTGTLPDEWSLLDKVKLMELYNNSLQGMLPNSWSSMTQLILLIIGTNSLEGTFPSSWSSMSMLQIGGFDYNRFEGTLPSVWSTWVACNLVFVGNNYLSGSLPESWSTMSKMQALSFSSNSFTGTLPWQWSTMSALKMLEVYTNSMEGTLPVTYSRLTQMVKFSVDINNIEGSIPSSWCSWSSLSMLELNFNMIEGDLKMCWEHISFLSIAYCKLDSITQLSIENPLVQLTLMNISSNNIVQSADLINTLLTFPVLRVLDTSNNQFSGTLHFTRINDSQTSIIRILDVSDNCLQGELDDSICQLEYLKTFMANILNKQNKCKLSSSYYSYALDDTSSKVFPSCLLTLPIIETVSMIGNAFTGTLSPLPDNTSLSFLSLTSNRLSGTLPISIQTYGRFDQLFLSFNKLQGLFSSDFAVNESMTHLNLSSNRLSGKLPPSFQQLDSMDVVLGNIISCESHYSNDYYSKSYSCGSIELTILGYVVAVVSFLIISLCAYLAFVVDKAPFLIIREKIYLAYQKYRHLIHAMVGSCMVLLIIVFSIWNDSALNMYREQYGWNSTTTFLHGLPIIVVILCVTMSIALVVYCACLASEQISSAQSIEDPILLSIWSYDSAKLIGFHLINIAVIGGTTGFYVYFILMRASMLIQVGFAMLLSLIKVVWSAVYIPTVYRYVIMNELLSQSKETNESGNFESLSVDKMTALYPRVLRHEIMADIWCFVLCPLVTILLTTDQCIEFLLLGVPPVSITYVGEHGYTTVDVIVSLVKNVTTVDINYAQLTSPTSNTVTVHPPWLYSFECSSAIITSYVSIVYYTYLIYLIAIPMFRLIMHYIEKTRFKNLVVKVLARWKLLSLLQEFLFLDEENDITNVRRRSQPLSTAMTTEATARASTGLDVSTISRRIRKASVPITLRKHRLHIRHHVLFLVFGLSSPLLGLLIVATILMEDAIMSWRVGLLKDKLMVEHQLDGLTAIALCQGLILNDATNVNHRYLTSWSIVAVVYWSLYSFDVIGDVYGGIAGIATMVVVFCINIIAIGIIYKITENWQQTKRSIARSGVPSILHEKFNHFGLGRNVSMVELKSTTENIIQ